MIQHNPYLMTCPIPAQLVLDLISACVTVYIHAAGCEAVNLVYVRSIEALAFPAVISECYCVIPYLINSFTVFVRGYIQLVRILWLRLRR